MRDILLYAILLVMGLATVAFMVAFAAAKEHLKPEHRDKPRKGRFFFSDEHFLPEGRPARRLALMSWLTAVAALVLLFVMASRLGGGQ